MIEALAGDTPTNSNRAGDQMIPMPETVPLDAYRGKSFADNLNYPQTTPSISSTGGSMPTQPRDTWSDWFDDAEESRQVTLEGLFERYPLDDVTADQVRYWQKAGVLPQPVKRWHDGATRALYPATYAFMAIVEIQNLQKRGYTLQQITKRLRSRFRAWNIGNSDFPGWQKEADQLADQFSKMTGNTVDQVRIVFVDEDGSEDTYGYTVGSGRT